MPSAHDLAGIPLFASLDDPARAQLASWFEDKAVEAGSRLIGEGAPGYSFFVLTAGTAVVSSGGTTLRELGPGDFFGEIAILNDSRRSASVTTTSAARLLVMFGSEFRRLQQTQPGIASRLEAAMRERLAPRAT